MHWAQFQNGQCEHLDCSLRVLREKVLSVGALEVVVAHQLEHSLVDCHELELAFRLPKERPGIESLVQTVEVGQGIRQKRLVDEEQYRMLWTFSLHCFCEPEVASFWVWQLEVDQVGVVEHLYGMAGLEGTGLSANETKGEFWQLLKFLDIVDLVGFLQLIKRLKYKFLG